MDAPRLPLRSLVALAVAAVGASVWALATMSIDRSPSAAAGAANLRALWPWWTASALGWLTLTALWYRLRSERAWRLREALGVFVVAAVARAAIVASHSPALSDDVYRYVFDGRNTAAGVNPYTVSPLERRTARPERWTGEHATAQAVNNPELHTIYMPTSQIVFAVGGTMLNGLGDRAASPEAGATVVRAAVSMLDLVVIGLVLAILRVRRASASWAALYAWHPLVLAEVAGSGHQDVIGLVGLTAAVLIGTSGLAATWRWTVPLALAALVKPMALVAAPFLLRGGRARSWLTSAAVGALVCAALWVPFAGADALDHLLTTARRFSLKWAHFGSVYEPVLATLEASATAWGADVQERVARAVCFAGVLVVGGVTWCRVRNAIRAISIVFLGMVLFSPAAHPWYLLWALALLPVARVPAVWIASLTLPWGYAVLADPVEWTVAPWVMVAAYAPIYGTLIVTATTRRERLP